LSWNKGEIVGQKAPFKLKDIWALRVRLQMKGRVGELRCYSANEADYVPAFERLGYELRFREPAWYEHRMLRLSALRVNLRIFSAGCEEVARMIRFRDHLRDHAEDRLLYERCKIGLASQNWKYMQAYADATTAVIASILERAGPSSA
jgi:GrpB-like predicted nucleotidyltransferase (UPF0157 family)